ncbi:MAG TPA: TetR/AcrR family transcriptional regulator, partial [Ktedonobacterales bacterium]|nr:TetR/AcrR family transcriptional regulator [Ktedonobacterales bacterium]
SPRHADVSDGGKEARASHAAEPADAFISDAGKFDLSALQAALHPALEDLPRAPRQARSREKRAELLRAAEALFVARGYAATTADEIASAAGVSVGTFYNYFRNKRQILLALALLRLTDVFAHLRIAQLDLAHGDHHAAIQAAMTAVLTGGQRPGLRGVWQQLMSLEPELAPYQATVRRYALNLIAQRLREARDEATGDAGRQMGGVWPDLDIEGTAVALLAMLDNLSARRDDDLPDERVIAAVTALIERAIFSPACAPHVTEGGAP